MGGIWSIDPFYKWQYNIAPIDNIMYSVGILM